MKKTMAVLLLVLTGAAAQAQITTNLVAKAFDREFQTSVGGTYNTALHKGGTDLRAGWFFTPNLGIEAGSMWQGMSGTMFNNASFGAVARLPLERWLPKSHLAVYVRGGGQYDWHDWSTVTYSDGKSVTVGSASLPCQSGTTSITVQGGQTATINAVGHWAGYFGPGFEWRLFQNRTGLLAKLGLFGEYSYWMRSGAPNNSLFECGVRMHL